MNRTRFQPRLPAHPEDLLPSPACGRGVGGEGALVFSVAQVSERFRAAVAARATFSLRAQRESSQRERAPRGAASRPSMDGKSVSRGRAFRAGSCPREKTLPSLATPAARPCRPRLTAAEGPHEKRARIVRARSNCNSNGRAPRACSSSSPSPVCRGGLGWGALASARLERAALPGAPMARRVGEGKSAGWLAGMRASFSPGQESRRKTPQPARAPAGQEARRARHRGGLSFGYFSLATQRKVARAATAARNRFVHAISGRRERSKNIAHRVRSYNLGSARIPTHPPKVKATP